MLILGLAKDCSRSGFGGPRVYFSKVVLTVSALVVLWHRLTEQTTPITDCDPPPPK